MTHGVLLRPDCVSLVDGDVVVGLLLSQIAYWHAPTRKGKSKLSVERDGVYWIAKTGDEWMAETGLTLEQYKRAIRVLKQKGLVEVKVMRYHGLAVGHLRLLHSLAEAGGKDTTRGAADAPTGQRVSHQPISTETTHRDYTQIALASGASSAETNGAETDVRGEDRRRGRSSKEVPEGEEEDHPRGQETPMKATEVLQGHQASTTGSLGAYWKSRCALTQGGFQKALTNKEHGQLKMLSKQLKEHTRPVIAYVIEHWWKFATEAGASAGVPFPSDPHIGFLLAHHAVAMNLLIPGVGPPKVQEAPVQLIATGTDAEPAYQPSPQELTALLAGLKAP